MNPKFRLLPAVFAEQETIEEKSVKPAAPIAAVPRKLRREMPLLFCSSIIEILRFFEYLIHIEVKLLF